MSICGRLDYRYTSFGKWTIYTRTCTCMYGGPHISRYTYMYSTCICTSYHGMNEFIPMKWRSIKRICLEKQTKNPCTRLKHTNMCMYIYSYLDGHKHTNAQLHVYRDIYIHIYAAYPRIYLTPAHSWPELKSTIFTWIFLSRQISISADKIDKVWFIIEKWCLFSVCFIKWHTYKKNRSISMAR